jgi:hypothetical protein
MKNKLYSVLAMLTLLSLIGCASGPKIRMLKDANMYYQNWSLYDSCEPNGSVSDATHSDCYKNGKYVERIYPLTDEQMYYLRRKLEQEQQESAEAWANIANSASQVMNSVADGYNKQADMYNNMSKSMSQMPSPLIQPITPYGSKKNYNCITMGISTNCREQ